MKTLLQNPPLLQKRMRWGLFRRFRFHRRQGGGDSLRNAYHLDTVSRQTDSLVWRYMPPRVNFLNLPPRPRPAPGGPPGAMIVSLRV
jgi:hypothetical protein